MNFDDMTPTEKIDHIERCLAKALPEVKGTIYLADILDVFDYWAPYMIGRLRKLEAVATAAKDFLEGSTPYYDTPLAEAVAALESEP